jgi:hypothetical protein
VNGGYRHFQYQKIRVPALGVLLVVISEGFLVFLACNYLARASRTASPGLLRCSVVSLLNNVCSTVAFPLLTVVGDRFGWWREPLFIDDQ